MAVSRAVVLCANNSVLAATNSVLWEGGFANLTIIASTYPTTCFLQTLGQDGATWINLAPASVSTAPATIAANGSYGYNLSPGRYRMNLSGGAVSAMYATLVTVTYE